MILQNTSIRALICQLNVVKSVSVWIKHEKQCEDLESFQVIISLEIQVCEANPKYHEAIDNCR